MKILPRRLLLLTVATNLSGERRTNSSAMRCVKSLASRQVSSGAIGKHTCNPLPPGRFNEALELGGLEHAPELFRRATDLAEIHVRIGIEIEHDDVGMLGV